MVIIYSLRFSLNWKLELDWVEGRVESEVSDVICSRAKREEREPTWSGD